MRCKSCPTGRVFESLIEQDVACRRAQRHNWGSVWVNLCHPPVALLLARARVAQKRKTYLLEN